MKHIIMQEKSESKNNISLLFMFPMQNLLFMHYFFCFSELLEWTWLYIDIRYSCNRKDWMGLGHTFLTIDYVQSVDYTTYKISDMINNSVFLMKSNLPHE